MIKRNKKGHFKGKNEYTFSKGHKTNVGKVNNPAGKGGFQERPEDRSGGYWKSEHSISFQYKKLIKMTVKEFREWLNEYPEDERTMAQEIAHQAVLKARKQLLYLKEVTDRTEGKSPQSVDMTTAGESFNSFDDQQIEKIAGRIARGKGSDGDSPSE